MSRIINSLALAAVAALAAGQAHAYTVFSGVDPNGTPTKLATTPLSSAAETSFKSKLTGVGTETFETQTVGAVAPLTLDFGVAGTAQLTGGNGRVSNNTLGEPSGRYSVPGGTQFWSTQALAGTGFSITFSQDIAAFGFYGIDIGEVASGTVRLELRNAADVLIRTLNVTSAAGTFADGSVLYFGAIIENDAEQFRSIRFITSSGVADNFGFDSFTIGTKSQVVTEVPEPATLALVGLGLLGVGLSKRRRA